MTDVLPRFDVDELRQLAKARLRALDDFSGPGIRLRGDGDLEPSFVPPADLPQRHAAVLVGLVDAGTEANVLLTLRTEHLPNHAGQIAFPGGKMESHETSPIETALREAYEETGLEASFVEPVGLLDPYLTGTGFRIVPVVAIVHSGFTLDPDPGEVAEVFEVPLTFLMDPINHQRHERVWNGQLRRYYAMPYLERYIWGATAGMLRNLYDRLYGD